MTDGMTMYKLNINDPWQGVVSSVARSVSARRAMVALRRVCFCSLCLLASSAYAGFQAGPLWYEEVYDPSSYEPDAVVGVVAYGYDWELCPDVLTIPSHVTYEYDTWEYDGEGEPRWCHKSKLVPVVGVGGFSCWPVKKIILPDTIGWIEEGAFWECLDLTEINVPDGVEVILRSTFMYCSALRAVELPSSVSRIEDDAFAYCDSLQTVKVRGRLECFDRNCFEGCSNLCSVSVYKGPAEIADYAFSGCSSLENAPITDETVKIGYCAFYGCTALKTVTVPSSVVELDWEVFRECTNLSYARIDSDRVGQYMFVGCSKLQKVDFSESCTNIGEWAFSDCSKLRDLTLPPRLAEIGECAFYGCGAIKCVDLPPSVTAVRGGAYEWSGITSVVARAENVVFDGWSLASTNVKRLVVHGLDMSFGDYCFSRFEGNVDVAVVGRDIEFGRWNQGSYNSLDVVGRSVSFDEYAFSGSSLKRLMVNASMIRIGKSAFANVHNLNDGAIIGDDVYIGDEAFSGVSFTERLPMLSEGLRHVGTRAFSVAGWSSAEKGYPLTLPKSVEYVGPYAFQYANISRLEILGDTCIGYRAFSNCDNLSSLDINGNVTFDNFDGVLSHLFACSHAFANCDRLERVALAYDDITRISPSDYAFCGCTSICEIAVKDILQLALFDKEFITPEDWVKYYDEFDQSKVKSVSVGDFMQTFDDTQLNGFTNIQQISFAGGVSSVLSNGFVRCQNLESLDFGPADMLTDIGANAFRGLRELREITLPGSLKRIGDNAFRDCIGLSVVDIENGVQEIGTGAFHGCTGFRRIRLPTPHMLIYPDAFHSCSNLEEVVFGGEAVIGNDAFGSCTSLKDVDLSTLSAVMDRSFANCTSLKKLVVPKDLDVFGDGAFECCSGLEELEIDHREVYDRGVSNLFGSTSAVCTVKPKKVKLGLFPNGMSSDCIEELTVVEGTTAGSERLYTPQSAKKVNLPASLVEANKLAIGGPKFTVAADNPNYAHDGNHSLRSKDGTEMLGWANVSRRWHGGLWGESSLMLREVSKIGDRAFQNCDKLENLCCDSHVTSIGKEAFKGLPNLECVSFGMNLASIGDSAFEDCAKLRIVNPIPKSLKSLGKRAFANCTSTGNYVFEGKPPKASGTNSTQYAFAGAPSFAQCQGEYFQKYYDAWTNKVGKLGQWQGLHWVCIATNTVEYKIGNLTVGMRAICDRLMSESGFVADETSCAELSEGTTDSDFIKSEILGVEPTMTISDDVARFSVDADFKVEDFQIDAECKTASLKVSVTTKNGRIPANFSMGGTPVVQVSENLADGWTDLNGKDDFSVVRVDEHSAVLQVTIDLSDYKFFRAKVD